MGGTIHSLERICQLVTSMPQTLGVWVTDEQARVASQHVVEGFELDAEAVARCIHETIETNRSFGLETDELRVDFEGCELIVKCGAGCRLAVLLRSGGSKTALTVAMRGAMRSLHGARLAEYIEHDARERDRAARQAQLAAIDAEQRRRQAKSFWRQRPRGADLP